MTDISRYPVSPSNIMEVRQEEGGRGRVKRNGCTQSSGVKRAEQMRLIF